jgi:hypothetical protein
VVVALSLLLEYVLRRCLEPLKKGARP